MGTEMSSVGGPNSGASSGMSVKGTLALAAGGAGLGVVLMAVISPRLLMWWSVPPFQQTGCNCEAGIQWAVDSLLRNLLIGGVSFGVLVPLLVFIVRRKKAVPLSGS